MAVAALMVMKTMTKLIGLGAIAGGAFAASRIAKRIAARREQQSIDDAFDFGDIDEPVVVTEEVVVVTEAGPYEIDMELVPVEEAQNENQAQPQQQQQDASSFDMPGRGAGPR